MFSLALMIPISALIISLGYVLVRNPRFLVWGVDGPVFLILVTIMALCHNRSFELLFFGAVAAIGQAISVILHF
jgi:hypothetical protein